MINLSVDLYYEITMPDKSRKNTSNKHKILQSRKMQGLLSGRKPRF